MSEPMRDRHRPGAPGGIMAGLVRMRLLMVLGVLVGIAGAQRPLHSQGARGGSSARVITLAVLGANGQGFAQYLTCTAVAGKGEATLNNTVPNTVDGKALLQSFRASLVALRAAGNLPGGARADYKTFDIDFEFQDRSKIYSQGSAAIAAAVVAFGAMTRTPLRNNVAMTGDVGIDGRVQGVGGLAAKCAAAIDAGASLIIVPAGNIAEVDALPFDQRVAIPIIPVSTLGEALIASLGTGHPAARDFDAYLSRRQTLMATFSTELQLYVDQGGKLPAVLNARPDLDDLYRSQFYSRKEMGRLPELIAELETQARQVRLDVGLRSILQVSKLIHLQRAAKAEVEKGDRLFAARDLEGARKAFEAATRIHPTEATYRAKLAEVAEAQFLEGFRPQIDAAVRKYRDGLYDEAAKDYEQLAESTRGHKTPFLELRQLAVTRSRSTREPASAAARRAAGDAAVKAGYLEDALEEYDALLKLAPLPAHAQLLFSTRFQLAGKTATGDQKPDLAPAVARCQQQVAAIQPQVKPGEAAALLRALAGVLVQYGQLKAAAESLKQAQQLGPTTEGSVELARTYSALAGAAKPEERAGLFAKAAEVLEPTGKELLRNEEYYQVREEVDRGLGEDRTPPFLALTTRPAIRRGIALSGSVQLSVLVRDLSGVTEIEATAGGVLIGRVGANNVARTTQVLVLDTKKLRDGEHALVIKVTDAKGNAGTETYSLTVKNAGLTPVWGNVKTKTYHLPTCTRAPVILDRAEFGNSTAAETLGYKPCFRCIR